MQTQEIFDLLKQQFGESIISIKSEPNFEPFIEVQPASVFDVCLFLRDDDKTLFDYLMCLSGVHAGENLQVVYHAYSTKLNHKVVLKVTVPRSAPDVPSVERVWRTADWHEREAYDLIGVVFGGHHNMIRILCPYDWEGHPLQKDYVTPEYYHDMKVPY